MALFKNIHQRRQDGDIILYRKEAFLGLGGMVETHFPDFEQAHKALTAADQARGNANMALVRARIHRDGLGDGIKSRYQWGFHSLAWPAYDDFVQGILPDQRMRDALYAGGSATQAFRSRQWLIDSVNRLLGAIDGGLPPSVPKSAVPEAFVADLRQGVQDLMAAIEAVQLAADAHSLEIAKVNAARTAWDQSYRMLVDLTKYALQRNGVADSLGKFVPSRSASAGTSEEVVEEEVLVVVEEVEAEAEMAEVVAPPLALPEVANELVFVGDAPAEEAA